MMTIIILPYIEFIFLVWTGIIPVLRDTIVVSKRRYISVSFDEFYEHRQFPRNGRILRCFRRYRRRSYSYFRPSK